MWKVLVSTVKYKFLNSMQCMVYLFSIVYKIWLAYFDLQSEQGLFQFDTKSAVSVCKVVQILETEMSSFYFHLFQMSLISYYDIDTNVTRPNHSLCSFSKVLSLPHLIFHIVLMGVKEK